ncbi:MAG: iron-sulfur cluster assembly protein [Alphaproteobacteria bacterium]|nr:iron-sulfur cluster assembly protein [Alphaproteobacteria bacterium]
MDASDVQAEKTPLEPAPFGERVVEQLKTIYDPEIPVNIYDLGLIYNVRIDPADGGAFDVTVDMTLTSPSCPIAEELPIFARQAVEELAEARTVVVNLVWDPPWDRSRMSDEARMQLDMF